jgi:N-acetylmuramoyl-L-alanine amidase
MANALPWPPTDPTTVMALTIWMEARGDGTEGMKAVASVILNRVNNPRWWGHDIVSVCLMNDQFSSWNPGSIEIPLAKSALAALTPSYKFALNIAQLAMSGAVQDSTENSDSYYAVSDKEPPDWAVPEQFVKQIGRQRFYRTELPDLIG